MTTKTIFTLGLLALAGSASVAVSGETLSAETVLVPAEAGRSEFYPGGRDSYYPGAAYGKDTYLVAWQAGRMQEGDIVACRVSKAGKVLDEKPFVVSAAADDQERPHIASGKDVFLVVWSDLRNGKDYDIYAARVTPEGKVLDPDGIVISGGPHNQVRSRLAFDGGNFIVAWMDFRTGSYQVRYARVTPDGKVLDPDGVVIGTNRSAEPAVASAGGGRSLVTMFTPTVPTVTDGYAGVFLQDGKPTSERVAPLLPGAKPDYIPSNRSVHRAVAAGKNGYLLAARNYMPAGRSGVGWGNSSSCLIVRPDGSREPLQTLTGTLHRIEDPDIVWDGTGYVAVWTDPTANAGGGDDPAQGLFSRIYAIRLDENGRPVLAPGQPAPAVSEKQVSPGQRLTVLTPPGQPTLVAGAYENPAHHAAAATDGAGTTFISYERHPENGDIPVKIAFRFLTVK